MDPGNPSVITVITEDGPAVDMTEDDIVSWLMRAMGIA
jgi:hypothetical protein